MVLSDYGCRNGLVAGKKIGFKIIGENKKKKKKNSCFKGYHKFKDNYHTLRSV